LQKIHLAILARKRAKTTLPTCSNCILIASLKFFPDSVPRLQVCFVAGGDYG
jgi:hypothetical protein